MCDNSKCKHRLNCYRAMAPVSQYQSWAIFEPESDRDGLCEHFVGYVQHNLPNRRKKWAIADSAATTWWAMYMSTLIAVAAGLRMSLAIGLSFRQYLRLRTAWWLCVVLHGISTHGKWCTREKLTSWSPVLLRGFIYGWTSRTHGRCGWYLTDPSDFRTMANRSTTIHRENVQIG
jgi:hypothetical protein